VKTNVIKSGLREREHERNGREAVKSV
jgi:hypothetical protein